MLADFKKEADAIRQSLFDELVNRATDPTIYLRRFRMLSQISLYESQVISKIYNMETDDIADFESNEYINGLCIVANRNG